MKNILRDVTNHSPQGLGYVITTNICTTLGFIQNSSRFLRLSYMTMPRELYGDRPLAVDFRSRSIRVSCLVVVVSPRQNLPDTPPHSPVMCNNLYNYLRDLDARHYYYTYVIFFGFNFGFVFFFSQRVVYQIISYL